MSSSAQRRLTKIEQTLSSPVPLSSGRVGVQSPNDVVIVSALRTPICKAKRGSFKDTLPDLLLAAVLRATHENIGVNPAVVQDIVVGSVLAPGAGANPARMAALYAGYPEETAVMSVNRQCSSGLQACAVIAQAICAGTIDAGIGAGVESMSLQYGPGAMGETSQEIQEQSTAAADCLLPMGITSENVAREYGVTRQEQDVFAAASHVKAAKAQAAGWFQEEIIPVTVTVLDKQGQEQRLTVSQDDGIRPGTTLQSLSKLKPAFDEQGTTTAGNASQVSDGAAAVLLMRRSRAQELGLAVMGKWITSAVVGVPPRVMGIGPAVAIPQACLKAGVHLNDLDVIELNEAFASQAVYCIKTLNLDPARVNPKGGAIALGHPLGCTGARQVATLLTELKRQDKRLGAISMCIGSGMGMCAIIERE